MSMIRRNLKRRAEKKAALDLNNVQKKPETNNTDDFSQYMNPPEEAELPFVTGPQGRTYTKTEINRMPTAELKILAKNYGVEDAEDMTGGELKKALIEILKL